MRSILLRRKSVAAKACLLAALTALAVTVYYYSNSDLPNHFEQQPGGWKPGREAEDETLDSLQRQAEELKREELANDVYKKSGSIAEPLRRQVPWIRHRFDGDQEIRVASGPSASVNVSHLAAAPICHLQELYTNLVSEVTATCSESRRYGRAGDGGWRVCFVGPYRPKPGACVSMSFGVGGIWEYDDAMAEELRCRALAFDPSEPLGNHTRPSGVRFFRVGVSSRRGFQRQRNWTVDSFASLADSLAGSDADVDLLKLDIETDEWEVLEAAASAGALRRVKQLLVEFHTKELRSARNGRSVASDYARYVRVLLRLRRLGFRLWRSSANEHGRFFSQECHYRQLTCCRNNYYVNVNYLPARGVAKAKLEAALHRGLHEVRVKPVRLPAPPRRLTPAQAESLYFSVVTADHAECPGWRRVGPQRDSGYDLCLAGSFRLRPGCLVYSFGVGDQFGFEDELATDYSCHVRMFDPSTLQGDHKRGPKEWFYAVGLGGADSVRSNGWPMRTLATLLARFGHAKADVDVLKIDIEFDEWESLEAASRDGSLLRVKQLVLETHTKELMDKDTAGSDYLRFVGIWYDLYRLGFRQWKNLENPRTHFRSESGHNRPCCYVHSLINTRFL